MKKFLVFMNTILLLTGFSIKGYSQYPFDEDLYYTKTVTTEIGASLGIMNCFTDLGGTKAIGQKNFKDNNFENSQLDASVYIGLMYKYAVGLRIEATFGHVKASDETLESVNGTTYGRFERNLSFKSPITEFSLIAEVHPRYFRTFSDGAKLPRLSPYLLGGVGFFAFKPQAELNGEWVDLKPLKTEGQGFTEYPDRKPYKLTQFVCPVGIGIKYKMTPIINLSLECVYRVLFTDYLDDVSTKYIDPNVYGNYFSGQQLEQALKLNDRQGELNPTHINKAGFQRGNPNNKDSYYTLNIKLAALL